tara:strand:+ start:1847 stop:2446 length:600 start_codon:yes stop_codon:yes gene_type:complete
MTQKNWKICMEKQLEPILKSPNSSTGLSTYSDMPFGIFLYPPSDEWELRQSLKDLIVRLENTGKTIQRLSIAKLIEKSLQKAGLSIEEVAQAEIDMGIEIVRDTFRDILSGHAAGSTPLDKLVAEEVERDKPTSNHIIFIERVGTLYGFHRPSALLENLHHKVKNPVVLFYPGHQDGPAGLRFMGEAEADHNYRPKLFA